MGGRCPPGAGVPGSVQRVRTLTFLWGPSMGRQPLPCLSDFRPSVGWPPGMVARLSLPGGNLCVVLSAVKPPLDFVLW